MKLTMALASRGRPDLLLKTVKRTAENMVLSDTTFLVLLDADDKTATYELMDQLTSTDKRVRVDNRSREDSRGEKYDRALTEAPADIYLPTCDYSAIVTPGFDRLIVEAAETFPDGIGVVNTQMANLSFPHYQAVTAKWVEIVGYIYPHHFPFWFIDHWLDDLARMTGRGVFADIECAPEPIGGTHKTIGLRDLNYWADLYDIGQVEREREASAIIERLVDQTWHKTALKKNWPLVHHRSWSINEGVRNNADHIERTRGGVESEADERYKRIKARADDLMQKWHRELTAKHKITLAVDNTVPAEPKSVTSMSPEEVKELIGENSPQPENAQRVICLALLAYDSRILTRTMMCLMNSVAACAARGWGFTVLMRDADSMVARGRSLLASQFLENPGAKQCSDLVMVDTDLAWEGQGDNNEFVRLCNHNVDVVGAAYPFKDESGDFPLRWPADGLYEREDGLWEVQAATPGFFRMTRRALEKIAREMPWLEFKDKPTAQDQRQWMFFDNKHRPSGIYDEGYIFCENWRTVGGKTYIDPDINLTHIGLKCYNHGTLREWLDKKAKVVERLQSEYPGIPPLVLGKAAMGEKVDLDAEMAKVKPESAA